MSVLDYITFWHWIAFGCALLAAELLGTAGYLLWLGVSALIMGVILSIFPLNWQLQWIGFAFFSLFSTWVWWRKQSKADKASDLTSTLNQKHKQLIGTVITLDKDFPAGINRVNVADTTWSAQSDQDLAAGTRVKIVAMDGIVLKIEPL